jgi:hypothetical protein
MRPVVRQEAILTTEPMDRSIPAVNMAKVCPTLRNPRGATWRSRFSRFLKVRNTSESTLVTSMRSARMIYTTMVVE